MLSVFTQGATRKEELLHNMLCTHGLLASAADQGAYRLGQTGVELKRDLGGKECRSKEHRHMRTVVLQCVFLLRTTWFRDFPVAQWDGFAEHINLALVEMTVLQLPFIVLDANLMPSFPCQNDA